MTRGHAEPPAAVRPPVRPELDPARCYTPPPMRHLTDAELADLTLAVLAEHARRSTP